MAVPAGLVALAGAWAGTNGFRLMPDDPLAEAPASATVSSAAGGNLAVVAYTWAHPQDSAQDGLLVVGAAEEAGGVTGFWGDSWHQSPTPRAVAGTADGDVLTVGYEYAPGWQWKIVVDPTDPATLRLRMDNATPDSGPYPAMLMELRPA